MRHLLLFALFPQLVAALPLGNPQTMYQDAWKSEMYAEQSFPTGWSPPLARPTERDMAAYRRYRPQALSIRDVVSHFGRPDRFLVDRARPEGRWLIYDLPDGAAVGFYLPVRDTAFWGIGVVLDSAGRLLQLIESKPA